MFIYLFKLETLQEALVISKEKLEQQRIEYTRNTENQKLTFRQQVNVRYFWRLFRSLSKEVADYFCKKKVIIDAWQGFEHAFCSYFNPLSASPTKLSNTLKQFVGNSRRSVWVCLTILWGWCLKG